MVVATLDYSGLHTKIQLVRKLPHAKWDQRYVRSVCTWK